MQPKKLSICMVTTFYPPYHFGGDAILVYRLTEALARRGHHLDVIHSKDAYHLQHPDEPEVEFSQHPNVRIHRVQTRSPLSGALAAHQLGRPGPYSRFLRGILESNKYDIIHFHNISLLGGPGILRYGTSPKLYTAHEYWLICPTHVLFRFDREACTSRTCLRCTVHSGRPPQIWRFTRLLANCLENIDCMLMPSQFSHDLHRSAGIKRPMMVLPHFVPQDGQGSDVSFLPQRPFFLYVGRLEKLKGVQDLITVFSSFNEADLIVAGTGLFEAKLREQAKSLPHIRFLGAVHPAKLMGLYQGAVALLAPSLCYETFGMTVAEAFARGTPAIVRNHGALAELIEQSGGGLGFTTLEECRQAMQQLHSDPQLRASLGSSGRNYAEQFWSEQAHLSRYLQVIESLGKNLPVSPLRN